MIGMATGCVLCEFLAPFSTGLIEFAVMIGLVAGLAFIRACPQSWLPLPVAVLGYAFAWISSFVFEQNRPATFIYPTYSLMCDNIMWYQTLTGVLLWNEYLE